MKIFSILRIFPVWPGWQLPLSKSNTATDVDEEIWGILPDTPSETGADFKVSMNQVMGARTNEVLDRLPLSSLAKNAEILDMGLPAFPHRHLQDG
jgi:hypothetical protein